MADPYGIEVGLKAAFGMAMAMSHGTNRTEDLIKMLQDTDTVVCLSATDADDIRARCARHNKGSHCLIVPIEKFRDLFVRRIPYGAVYFTETWIEAYYTEAIQRAVEKLNEARKMLEVRIQPQQFELRTQQGERMHTQLASRVHPMFKESD